MSARGGGALGTEQPGRTCYARARARACVRVCLRVRVRLAMRTRLSSAPIHGGTARGTLQPCEMHHGEQRPMLKMGWNTTRGTHNMRHATATCNGVLHDARRSMPTRHTHHDCVQHAPTKHRVVAHGKACNARTGGELRARLPLGTAHAERIAQPMLRPDGGRAVD